MSGKATNHAPRRVGIKRSIGSGTPKRRDARPSRQISVAIYLNAR